ncbi:MAG TPA: type 2 lanthipeptide synthetase LanM family protein [Pyrinomonadaceae bacterium]
MKTAESDREPLLRRILAEASTLRERLDGSYSPQENGSSAKLAEARLEKWRERAAQGDSRLFEQRLSWLATTPEKVVCLLGDVRLEGEPPPWAYLFAYAMQARSRASQCARASVHPFGTILTPFVQAGIESLAPVCRTVFSKEILESLADDLYQQLSYVAAPSLYLEFSTYRTARGLSETASPEETRLYDAFTSNMLEGGLWDFFSQYPVLARLLSVLTQSWAQNVSELATALVDDMPDIRLVFGVEDDASALVVASVKPSLSDRHDGGRTVALLEFENDLKLVYKPRDIGIEKAWFSLLSFLNERGGDFHILKVLDRQGHGWVEAAQHAPCMDDGEAESYYVRAGMLLAVLYMMEASDCFFENVVACGAYPVLIDMETLMRHLSRRSADLVPAHEMADDIASASVLRTGFLPFWETSADGICIDISGLGAKAGRITPYRQRRWLNLNRDSMKLEHEPIRVESERHLPRLGGASLNVARYAEQVVQGFRQAYELLMELRSELSAADGLIENLGRQELRILFHATRIYGLLQKRLCAPRHMRSGVERSMETDVFSRFYLGSAEKSELWPILEAEIAAMERLDIPRFALPARERSLHLPTGRTIENAFEVTALERVRRKLSLLNGADLEMQTEFIRASLSISDISVAHASPEESTERWERDEALALSSDEFAGQALAIAALIEQRAIISNDASATWIAPQLLPQSSRYELRPLLMNLYNGQAGVALFFAALEHVTGTGRRPALAALAPLRRFIATADAGRMARDGYTLGAATGLGSFVYVLCRCALFLNDAALLTEARAAAEMFTPEWIAADEEYDITSGASGAILGLVALHQATGDADVLRKAVLCGDHLLGKRERAQRGAAWRAANGRFMTGLSHGAAGIALALLRLYKASGADRFRSVAEEALAYEDSVFDETVGNWPDFRQASGERPGFMNTWCHGAPGIGMARVSTLSILDTGTIRRDIEAALGVVTRGGIGERDGLCCGNLGRAELLLSASGMNTETKLEHSAAQLCSVVVARSRRCGGYRLSGRPGQEFFDPSFFQGLSGIGYQLLRIAHPDRLPSVLVWE